MDNITYETEREEEERILKAEQEEDELASVVEHLAKTDAGRRFLRCLLRSAGTLSANYSQEPLHLAQREGARSVGLGLLNLIRRAHCLDAVLNPAESMED